MFVSFWPIMCYLIILHNDFTWTGFCLLLVVSSDYAQPITGQALPGQLPSVFGAYIRDTGFQIDGGLYKAVATLYTRNDATSASIRGVTISINAAWRWPVSSTSESHLTNSIQSATDILNGFWLKMGQQWGQSQANQRHGDMPDYPGFPLNQLGKSNNVYLVIDINLWTFIDMDDTAWQNKNRVCHNYKSLMIDVYGIFWITSS